MNPDFTSIDLLAERAKKRIPRFVYEYLVGGCHSNVCVRKNTDELRQVELKPYYLREFGGASLETTIFGRKYSAPFGISSIGLQGLIWPRATEILARSAREHNVPFMLSTVATASIETIGEITEGDFWFQLYHPVEQNFRNALLDRASAAGCQTLVLLADTPAPGFRPHDIRNGLALPPRMSVRNILQMLLRPAWCLGQLAAGKPEFRTLKPYLPDRPNMKDFAAFWRKTFDGRLTEDKVRSLRDRWDGRIVIKGLVEPEEVEKAVSIGIDGVIISNHGGRQIDLGEPTISSLQKLSNSFRDRIVVMMDSGIRTGGDIAASIASGADFCFLGRTPMFAVAALGEAGGDHVMELLKYSLKQVMEQIGCERIADLPQHLVRSNGKGNGVHAP